MFISSSHKIFCKNIIDSNTIFIFKSDEEVGPFYVTNKILIKWLTVKDNEMISQYSTAVNVTYRQYDIGHAIGLLLYE